MHATKGAKDRPTVHQQGVARGKSLDALVARVENNIRYDLGAAHVYVLSLWKLMQKLRSR